MRTGCPAAIRPIARRRDRRRASGGRFFLSFVSGLTDVDAITLSSARLMRQDTLGADHAATAIALAAIADVLFKAAVSVVVGGRTLGRAAANAFALPPAALAAGLLALHSLA